MSQLLNRTDNVQQYTKLYEELADEFHRVFYNPTTGGYVDKSQAMNVLALALPNVVPETVRSSVLNLLLEEITTIGYFTGGIVSVAPLYPLLSNEGHHDLALKLALSISYPSYGYMFHNDIQNATTTWEQWNTLPDGARSSFNHHMFNSIGAWFYRYLAGIELNGLHTVTIYPRMSYDPHLLTSVQTEVVTIKGPIQINWSRDSIETMSLSIALPPNLDGIVSFDRLIKNGRCKRLICDNEIIWERIDTLKDPLQLIQHVDGLSDLKEDPLTGTMSIKITSGTYRFVASWE